MLRTAFAMEGLDYALPAGYMSRSATLDDVSATTAMFNAWARHVIGVDDFTENSVRVMWTAPQVDLAEDTRLIVAPDGQVAAYGALWGLFEPYTQVNTFVRIHPDHQQRGLEAALLDWAEEHARRVAFAKAADGTRICLRDYRPTQDTLGRAVFEQAGFTTVRYMHRMRIDLNGAAPSPVWPDGITVRSFVPGQDEAAVIEVQQAVFRDHWGYVAPTVEEGLKMLRHWMTDPDFDPALWLLVMAGERLVGISLNATYLDEDPDMGWVSTLGVLREYRKRGIARALLLHAFGQFQQRGRKRVGLGVDTQNLTGALRLYEGVGMHVYRTTHIFEKELRPGVELSTRSLT
jgi:mycothiol synthase